MSGSCAVEPREANQPQSELQQIRMNGEVDTDTDSTEPTADDSIAN